MLRRVFGTALLGLMLIVPAVALSADKPAIILSLAPYDELRRDFLYIAGLTGQDESAVLLDQMIEARVGSNGRNGIDRNRPIGLYGWLGSQVGEKPPLVLLVPVADPDAFLSLLTNFDVRTERGPDGVYSANVENVPDPVYFRFANGYAYVAAGDRSVLDDDRLIAPGDVLEAGQGCQSHGDGSQPLTGNLANGGTQPSPGGPPCRNAAAPTLALVTYIDRVPDGLKYQLLQEFDAQLAIARLRDAAPLETEWQKKLRLATMDEVANAFRTFVNEGGETSLRFDLDRRTGEAALTVSVEGAPQSTMAAAIRELGQVTSSTAGLLRTDAAMSLALNVGLPERLRDLFGAVLDEGERDALAKSRNATDREIAATMFEGLMPTLKATELDWTFNLLGPGNDGLYAVAAGVRIKDGAGLERALRAAVAKDPAANVAWDVEREGSVGIHRVMPRGNEDARRILGDKPVYFAFRDDVLLVASGARGLDLIREALAVAPVTGKVTEMQVAVARLMPAAKNPAAVAAAADVARRMFGDDAGDGDRLHLTLEGGKAMTLRLEMKTKLIEFITRLGQAAR
jgi:hypothetical protein